MLKAYHCQLNVKSMITKCDKCEKAKRWKFNYER